MMRFTRWIDDEELEWLLEPQKVREQLAKNIDRELADDPIRIVRSDPLGSTIVMEAKWANASYSVVKVLFERGANNQHIPPRPTLNGSIGLYDHTGEIVAMASGAVFTGIRTAAIAALSTEWLAVSRARQSIIGSGFQAYYHAWALAAVPGVEEIRIWSRSPDHVRRLTARLSMLPVFNHIQLIPMDSLEQTIRNADGVTLVTTSSEPILWEDMLPPTVLINAMGAYLPESRELASNVVESARLFADYLPACLKEAGDYLIPISEGVVEPQSIRPLAAGRVDGPAPGRTIMKSVGSAVFDLSVAALLTTRR